jgi:hypothetical protein
LLDLKNADKNTREIASGYRGDAISMTAVRLALLLDADPKVVSFQNVYRRLERPEVVDALVRRARGKSPWAEALEDRVEENIRASVESFLSIYRAIDWHDLHGRLQHFRNHGLAHLPPQQIKRRVTFAEIRSLVRSVAALGASRRSIETAYLFVSMKSQTGAIETRRRRNDGCLSGHGIVGTRHLVSWHSPRLSKKKRARAVAAYHRLDCRPLCTSADPIRAAAEPEDRYLPTVKPFFEEAL